MKLSKKIFNINTVLILLVIVSVWGLFFRQSANKVKGSYATVTILLDGQKEEITQTIDLTADEVYHIEANLPVTLEVKDGSIRFVDSQCPDKLCEGFGWVSYEGESAICMPAGVAVLVVEGAE